MSKYLHVLNIGVQNTLVYRVNFLVRACFGLIPLTATLFMWQAIYAGKGAGGNVEGYLYGQMVSYYLIVTIVDGLTAVAEDDWQIAADIKDGNISQFLLKPIDYLSYRLTLYCGGRMIYSAFALIPIAIFIYFKREFLELPADAGTMGLFLISTLLAGLLQFFISYTMALLAFWVMEVSTFIFILFAFEALAGGQLFPLDILPRGVQEVLRYTPFPYEMFFPVSIYLGRAQGAELIGGLAMQTVWVGVAYLTARLVWRRGIRRYTASGG